MSDSDLEYVPLAIVGMSCRLPGATNLAEFWSLFVSGGDAAGELPADVLDRDLYYDPRRGVRGKTYSTIGGLVPRLPFDSAKCRLSDRVLADYDSAHRTICEVSSEALRDAGYDPGDVPTRKAGVYFGHTGGSPKAGDAVYSVFVEQAASYLRETGSLQSLTPGEIDSVAGQIVAELRRDRDPRDNSPGFDASANRAAELVARAFGLDGPCVVVDAACASSLQALALGARALQLGEIDMAVVGGASCCKSDSLVLFSQAQSISAGQSTPFDEDADGLVTAEGYVTIILKTLPRALADGDRIRCLIRGIGMAADGKGKSLWAPLKEGQVIAMRRAYPPSLQPQDIQYIEAHATSTQVGDATELTALAEAFPKALADGRKIPLGSVKANVGHTLESAGVAGLLKVVLAIEHGLIPPIANLKKPNTAVPWEDLPFHLPLTAETWERPAEGIPRRAAVNSFGIGGLNVHVVLEEYLEGLSDSSRGGVQAGSRLAASSKEPIAVIGAGAILPGANDAEQFWDLLVSGSDPKTDAPPDRWDSTLFYDPSGAAPYRSRGKRGGFITDYHYDWRRHRVPPKQVANANPLQFMLLDATEEALRRSGYLDREFDRERVGVFVGTIFGGDFSNQLQAGLRLPVFARSLRRQLQILGFGDSDIERAVKDYEDLLLAKMPALLDETGSFTSSTLASRITKTFNLKGGALAMDAGNGSGLAVIGACIDALRSRVCDMMVCAAGQRNMDVTAFESLTRLGYLAPGEAYPAYDARSQGYVPGEGCGVLVLKRLSDARRDGDPVLAILHGVAAATDWDEKGNALRRALQGALAIAGAAPREVRAIESLGILPELAKTEVQMMAEVLSGEEHETPVAVNSLVSQFGHMGATQGMAGTIKAVLSVARGQLPAGLVTNDPDTLFASSPCVKIQDGPIPLTPESSTVVVSCGSEVGTAYSLVVEHPHQALARAASRSPKASRVNVVKRGSQIVRVGAESWDALRELLQTGSPEQLYRPERVFKSSDRVRLAIVCAPSEPFLDKCRRAAEQTVDRTRQSRDSLAGHGIYFGEPQLFSGGCAFVFPGQGSQYAGMLAEMIAEVPEAQAPLRRADAAMAALGYESFTEIAGPDAKDLGTDVWKTQVAILLADVILEDTLRQLGLRPALVAGHSFGEYPALVCAGGWSLTDAIRCTRLRYRSIVETPPVDGCMAATVASPDVLQQCLSAASPEVHIANLNASDQTIIAGRRDGVERVVVRLKQEGHTAVLIKVPCPFHTPLMSDAARLFAQLLPEISLRDSVVPVVSTASSQIMTQGEEFRRSLNEQLTTPVNYRGMLARILDHNPALVVEVGPQQVLTRLNKKNCAAEDTVFISSDVRRRSGALSLLGVIAQAECLGCLELDDWRRTRRRERSTATAGRIVVHDATERRTARKKALALAHSSQTSTAREYETPVEIARADAARRSATESLPRQAAERSRMETAEVMATTPPSGQPERLAADAEQLRQILVGFVIDQTGYPEEIIQMDADLEADLGIDSIKKAQLFGEVGERFQIAPRDDLSLDDFPTLGDVLAFLIQEVGAPAAAPAMTAIESRVVTPVEPVAAPALQTAARDRIQTAAPVPAPPVSGQPERPSADAEQLRQILVGFVIEQTGYPEEIIEMDADLEADLGIDSIKKAQLFGEVGERFQIAPRDDLSLDDFPTLGDVLAFLIQEVGAPAAAPAVQAAAPAPQTVASSRIGTTEPMPAPRATGQPERPSADAEQLRQILVGFVIEQTGYPEEIIEMDADLEADLGIDSIKKAQLFGEVGERFQIAPRDDLSLDDFPTLGDVLAFLVQEVGAPAAAPAMAAIESRVVTPVVPVAAPALQRAARDRIQTAEPVPAAPASGLPERPSADAEQLRQILVGFVIEQTGYPEEIIEMDADLEADLGIDSIKKAQLFGEVGERFQIAPRDDLSLDDFPTLDDVLAFLIQEVGAPVAAPARAAIESHVVTPIAPVTASPAVPTVAPRIMDVQEIRKRLVRVVVEQTGFPEELIDMHAELDTDLGIDSDRKPHFLKMVGERFGLAKTQVQLPKGAETLDHVLDWLVQGQRTCNDGALRATLDTVASDLTDAASPQQQATPVQKTSPAPRENFFCVQFVEGSSHEMGLQHGTALREAVRREVARAVDSPPPENGSSASAWPTPWSAEISGIAAGAQVNREAVTLLNQTFQRLSALRIHFQKTGAAPRTPEDRDSITLVQIRKPADALAYLTLGKAGHVAVPAAVNAAHVAVSSEPLDKRVPTSDVIAVTTRLHRIAATARNFDDVEAQLADLSLQSRWCFGASTAEQPAVVYWQCGAGSVRPYGGEVSPHQQAFHRAHVNNPHELPLIDRHSGRESRLVVRDLLNGAGAAETRTSRDEDGGAATTVMRRYVMRMSPAPRPPAASATYGDGQLVYLVGESPLRAPLRKRLEVAKCRVQELHGRDARADADPLFAREVPRHLVLLSASEPQGPAWEDLRAAERFSEPFEICRLWIDALERTGAVQGASLVAVTRMGGDFGFQSPCSNYAGGALTGLLKGIRREFPALRVKALDFGGASEPSAIVSDLVDEVNSGAADLEVGFRGAHRYVVQAQAQPAPQGDRCVVPPGSVCVVTGGGRGVTAVVARELGRRLGLKLHLLGTAPLPEDDAPWRGLSADGLRDLKRDVAIRARQQGRNPADEWRRVEKAVELDRNLRQFADVGVRATYHTCDLREADGLAATLQSIRRNDGPIAGILHGAGIEAACRFVRKNQDMVRATIASKCDGAANLIALTSADPLQYFVAFGSTSGRFGGLGQADYSLASDLLAKMVDRLAAERPACRCICFHWPAWDDVGMAVRPESRVALQSGGIGFMPPHEGIAHLLAELKSPAGERELLILDKPEPLDTDGTMSRTSPPAAPDEFRLVKAVQASSRDALPKTSDTNAGGVDCARMPLIDRLVCGAEAGTWTATIRLNAARDPFLAEHRFRNRPILPIVMSIEAFVEAVRALRPAAAVTAVRDVRIVNAWYLDPQRERQGTVRLTETETGFACTLVGPFFNSRGELVESERVYASAIVEVGENNPPLAAIEPGVPTFTWFPFQYPTGMDIHHGEPFHTLVKFDFIHGGGRAVLRARPANELIGRRPGEGMLIAAALLDGCLVACGAWGYAMLDKFLEIPASIGCCRQARLPRDGEECIVRFFLREHRRDQNLYDMVVMGDDGSAILQIEGYRSTRVAENS